jgi:hypothetical protein
LRIRDLEEINTFHFLIKPLPTGRLIYLIRSVYNLRPCFVVSKYDLQRQLFFVGGDLHYHSQRSQQTSAKQKI